MATLFHGKICSNSINFCKNEVGLPYGRIFSENSSGHPDWERAVNVV
jgi:hypothetical protein